MSLLLRFRRLWVPLHRLLHAKVPKAAACVLCRAVWAHLERSPGFHEAMARGLADSAAGRWYRWDPLTHEVTPNPDWPKDGPQPEHRP